AEAYEAFGVRAQLHAPHISDGRCKFLLAAYRLEPHQWRPDELDVMRELSARLWLRLERARAEKALAEVTAQFERRVRLYEGLMSSTPDLQYVFGLDYRFTYANEATLEMWGRSREDAFGRSLLELGYEPWHAEMHEREIDTVVATRGPIRGVVPFKGTHGERIYDYIFVPVLDKDGEVEAVAGTTRDITELKKNEQALVEADRRKDRFLAVLSHELRNPLAPIKNSLYILDHAVPGGEQARGARQIINRQVDQLARLVDDLLDVTRVNQDKIQLQYEHLELNELVQGTVEDHRSLFEKRSIEVEFIACPEPVNVYADANRIAQVVGNLLQNAAKFTLPGGRTRVRVTRATEAMRACVHVVDSGVGMSPDTLSDLFEPFVQADASLDHSAGGLGLGLALVKGLIGLHGGAVSAHSAGLGQGAEFEFWLPLEESSLTMENTSTQATVSGQGRKVLLIEDNPDVALSLRIVLELQGHEVAVTHNGPDGIERARTFEPDVILCDIGLPEMDGHSVAQTLRSDPDLKSIYLVALSGYAMPADIKKSLAAGFDRHLAKPPYLDLLTSILAEAPAQA
ncbi:MAG: ATP-binding protein, partial [Bradymonadaceae bacterium]